MAKGDFTASHIPQLLLAIEEAWSNPMVVEEQELAYDTTVVDVMQGSDTNKLSRILEEGTGFCQGVKVTWLKGDELVATIEDDLNPQFSSCDIDGEEIQSESTTFNAWKLIKVAIKVRHYECDNIFTMNDKLTKQMAFAHRAIVKKIVEFSTAKLHSFAGPNLFDVSGDPSQIGYDFTTVTKINPGNFNWMDFVPYAMRFQSYNKYRNLQWIDGGIMNKQLILAQIQAGTSAGDLGQNKAFNMIKRFNDASETFIDAGIGPNKMYAIESGSVAFAYHNNFGERKKVQANSVYREQYEMPLQGLSRKGSPIMLDVTYKPQELPIAPNTNKCELWHTFELALNMNIFNNPTFDSGRTGIVEFESDAAKTKKTNIQPSFA